jgi:serine phosphatase RsbU (regulator of sigma subunit)
MFPEATYEALELPLEPGDRFVLYTDGILEAANQIQEQYGADRFMRFMESNTDLRAEQFADAFLREISCWSAESPEQGQQDDITLLVIGSVPLIVSP